VTTLVAGRTHDDRADRHRRHWHDGARPRVAEPDGERHHARRQCDAGHARCSRDSLGRRRCSMRGTRTTRPTRRRSSGVECWVQHAPGATLLEIALSPDNVNWTTVFSGGATATGFDRFDALHVPHGLGGRGHDHAALCARAEWARGRGWRERLRAVECRDAPRGVQRDHSRHGGALDDRRSARLRRAALRERCRQWDRRDAQARA
jgi:hypothetical protein